MSLIAGRFNDRKMIVQRWSIFVASWSFLFSVYAGSPKQNKHTLKPTPTPTTTTPRPGTIEGTDQERLSTLEKNKNHNKHFNRDYLRNKRAEEKNPLIRYRMNQALIATDAPEVVTDLVESLKDDKDPLVRQGAAQNLAQYANDPTAAQALSDQLSIETDSSVRYAIALSLCLSQVDVAMNRLDKATSDSDPLVRRQIAYGLLRNPNKKAQRIVRKLEHDKDASVRATAKGKS